MCDQHVLTTYQVESSDLRSWQSCMRELHLTLSAGMPDLAGLCPLNSPWRSAQ